ncbi:MAG TPA: glucose-6-phosphate dehydrogenase (coenzyme-F420) [Solirubrobacterales bacterium]|nr:glucose-6-phosphate dehydrogenase (coenzyme-F420) [Solirubrobacterales bacterium]
MRLKLGYKASAEQFGPQELLDLAVLAEEKGVDSVWVSDHYQPFRHTDGHAPFSLAWLGAATQRTRRVTLGTSVLTPTFRYHPSIVAQAFATLERLAPGRLILGIGTGESMNEVPVTGMEWPEFKVRFGRMKEAVELMRKLWQEDFVTYQGEYFQTRDVTLYDKPTNGQVPIYVGASGEVAARFAGRVADGFICTSGKGMELYSDKLLPAVREGAEKAGRDYDKIVKAIEMKVSYDHDRARAMEDTKLWAPLALPAEDKAGVEDPRELERRAKAIEDQAHRRWLVADNPDEHVEQLRPYVQLGFQELIFHSPTNDQEGFLDLYSEEILPRLRERW